MHFHPDVLETEQVRLTRGVSLILRDHSARCSVRAGGRRELWMSPEGDDFPLVVKVNRYNSWTRRFRQWWVGCKSEKEFESYRCLERADLPVPPVYGWGTFGGRRGLPSGCLLVSRRLEGVCTYTEILLEPDVDPSPSTLAIAGVLVRLRSLGFCHRDLRGSNLLVANEDPGDIFLLDAREIGPTLGDPGESWEEAIGHLLGYAEVEEASPDRLDLVRECLCSVLGLEEEALRLAIRRHRDYARARLQRKGHL